MNKGDEVGDGYGETVRVLDETLINEAYSVDKGASVVKDDGIVGNPGGNIIGNVEDGSDENGCEQSKANNEPQHMSTVSTPVSMAKSANSIVNDVSSGKAVNSKESDGEKANKTDRQTFAQTVSKNVNDIDNKLEFVPTSMNEKGEEVLFLRKNLLWKDVKSGN